MFDVVTQIVVALIGSGSVTLLIYAALDHSEWLEKRPRTTAAFKVALVIAAFAGAVYQFHSADLGRRQAKEDRARADAEAAQHREGLQGVKNELALTRQENVRLATEYQNKIQQARLDLAKAQTEAQMRAIRSEFSEWADTFPTNSLRLAEEIHAYREARANAERTRQQEDRRVRADLIARSCAPVLFAVRFTQESVRAYAERTTQRVTIEPVVFDDLIEGPISGKIAFSSGAVWTLSVEIRNDSAWFTLTFTDPGRVRTGRLIFQSDPGRKVVAFDYIGDPAIPDPSAINRIYDISGCETPVKRTYKSVLDVQLLQTVKE